MSSKGVGAFDLCTLLNWACSFAHVLKGLTLPSIFIFGSCVSRDTQPFLGPDWKAVGYVARQGMISATSPATSLEGESALTSKFQAECLRNDFASSLFDTIDERYKDTDIFVLDLVDERKGVYEVEEGVYITDSWELEISTLLRQQPSPLRLIAFGTDEHFELWRSAAETVMCKLAATGRSVVVLAPEWAENSDEGQTHLEVRGKTASEFNEQYVRYVNHLRGWDNVKLFTAGQDVAVAAAKHQWGLAPFHYVKPVYELMSDAIKGAYNRQVTTIKS